MSAQIYADTQNTVTEELISARRLWTAVLVHAVEEWRGARYALDAKRRTFYLAIERILRPCAPERGSTAEVRQQVLMREPLNLGLRRSNTSGG